MVETVSDEEVDAEMFVVLGFFFGAMPDEENADGGNEKKSMHES